MGRSLTAGDWQLIGWMAVIVVWNLWLNWRLASYARAERDARAEIVRLEGENTVLRARLKTKGP